MNKKLSDGIIHAPFGYVCITYFAFTRSGRCIEIPKIYGFIFLPIHFAARGLGLAFPLIAALQAAVSGSYLAAIKADERKNSPAFYWQLLRPLPVCFFRILMYWRPTCTNRESIQIIMSSRIGAMPSKNATGSIAVYTGMSEYAMSVQPARLPSDHQSVASISCD